MNQEGKKVTVNPLAAGFAGVVFGAAGAIIAIALTDKNNRKKVEQTISDAKKWGDKKFQEIKKMNTPTLSRKSTDEELDKIEDEAIEAIEKNKKTDDLSGRESSQVVK